MDEIVLRAMQKWPNVPRVYGWLRLDRRGRWLVKSAAGGFDAISNPAFIEFIGRNYAHDEEGRWFFQNGPQRVFVSLDYTPWIVRLDDSGTGLVSQAGQAVDELDALYLDEGGTLLVQWRAGAGIVLDRDLPALVERLQAENPGLADEETMMQLAGTSGGTMLRLFGRNVPFSAVRSSEMPGRCRFVPQPVPPEGQPDC